MNTSDITMPSLVLPAELNWDGKLEPISPPSSVLVSISELGDDWFFDNFAIGLPPLLDDEEDYLTIKGTLEVSEKLPKGDDVVIQLEHLKDEYMLDPKLLDYPIGIDIAQPNTITKVQAPLAATNIFNQSSFDNAVLAQLTPPQSPPRNSAASSPVHQQNNLFIESPNTFTGAISGIISPGPQSPASPAEPIPVSPSPFLNGITPTIIQNALPNNFNFHWSAGNQDAVIAVPNEANNVVPAGQNNSMDYEMDLQLLDEIVNIRAKELEEWKANEESETQSSFSQAGSTISDDDWQIESCYSSSVSSPNYQASSDDQITSNADSLPAGSDTTPTSTPKKRTRQYGRGVEDRKNRKKEQNKNAATRYRQRKKQEMETILVEELSLRKKNTELQKILEDAKREAKYLKNLLREFYESDKLKP